MSANVANPPWNFSWVVQDHLAAMAWPQTVSNLEYLVQNNIGHLVTLSPEKLPPVAKHPHLSWTRIDIEEFEAPTLQDIIRFIDICKNCRLKKQDLAPEKAITTVRLQRPGSVETAEQERAVVRYRDYLRTTEDE